MCLNEYATSVIVADRLNELRAAAERARIVPDARAPVRVAVGRSLIRIGSWLATAGEMPRSAAT
jgi:hypothetical protein